MTESAYEWGLRHGSCRDALEARKALGPDKTQADWWCVCPRGDWLLWQLGKLPRARQRKLRPRISRAIEVIATTAIVEHALDCGIAALEDWAAKWLSGEDRSAEVALVAWAAQAAQAAWAARTAWGAYAAWVAWAALEAELLAQANDIRAEIPAWPGGDND